ncbi:uncharacterized protein [Macaca fascicularis]|uniref:uncharacterized protein n=1 Tax=Macaca fascicularis TaxID=9541 RepID=UPI003D15DCED
MGWEGGREWRRDKGVERTRKPTKPTHPAGEAEPQPKTARPRREQGRAPRASPSIQSGREAHGRVRQPRPLPAQSCPAPPGPAPRVPASVQTNRDRPAASCQRGQPGPEVHQGDTQAEPQPYSLPGARTAAVPAAPLVLTAGAQRPEDARAARRPRPRPKPPAPRRPPAPPLPPYSPDPPVRTWRSRARPALRTPAAADPRARPAPPHNFGRVEDPGRGGSWPGVGNTNRAPQETKRLSPGGGGNNDAAAPRFFHSAPCSSRSAGPRPQPAHSAPLPCGAATPPRPARTFGLECFPPPDWLRSGEWAGRRRGPRPGVGRGRKRSALLASFVTSRGSDNPFHSARAAHWFPGPASRDPSL